MPVSRSSTTDSKPSPSRGRGASRAPKSEETRRRLLEAGRSLFAAHGPRAVTSHAIAAEAGYAAGTFYLHFKDKLELFRELAEEAATELEGRLCAVSEAKTEVADIMYGQADALVGFADEQRDLLRIIFHPGGEAGEIGQRILERLAQGVSARRRERSLETGSEDCFHPDVMAQAVVGMWAHVLAWWAEDPTRASRDELVRTLTHFQLHGNRFEGGDLCGFSPDSPLSTPGRKNPSSTS